MIQIEKMDFCSSNLIFRHENCIQDDEISIWPRQLTLNNENALILTVPAQKFLQDIKKYFDPIYIAIWKSIEYTEKFHNCHHTNSHSEKVDIHE